MTTEDTNDFVEYITVNGERLDTIAYRVYGDVNAWSPILAANPSLPITSNVAGGQRLRIPVQSRTGVNENSSLPPWKK